MPGLSAPRAIRIKERLARPVSVEPTPSLEPPRRPNMDRTRSTTNPPRIERELAHLKIISRLLGHELHVQQSPRLTLSREEIQEIQTSIDLFIEDALRSRGTSGAGLGATPEVEVQAAASRVN